MTIPIHSRLENTTSAGRVEWTSSDDGLRDGNEAAFASLFRHHYSALCDFVNSILRAPDDAEEVVQGVFQRLWESRTAWGGATKRTGMRAYLFTACRNAAFDLLRHEDVVARTADQAKDVFTRRSDDDAAHQDIENAELGAQLRAAVAALPKRRRLVVILRWQHQLSNGEIAQVLGISVKGVEMQHTRALADLRRRLAGARLLGLV